MTNNSVYYKCYHLTDSQQYCVRVFDKFTIPDSTRQLILKEISILRKIDHNALLKIFEVYEDEQNIFIIIELLHGKDLRTKLIELQRFEEKYIADIIWKMLNGLVHLHAKNIFHRDIKLDNIYLRNPNNLSDVVLVNFFLADFHDVYSNGRIAYKKCGTAGYIAPEIFS